MAQLLSISPGSLLNVALTCKIFYNLSKNFIYKTVYFTFNRSRRITNGALIRRLLEDDDSSRKVRCVRIHWAPNASLQSGEGSKEDLVLLGRALPKLFALHTFVWDAQYPIVSWLVDIVRSSHPECTVYIRHPPVQDATRTLSRLQDFPKLHALDASFLDGQFLAYKELGKLLTSSSIRDLTVTSPGDQIAILQVLWKLPGALHLRSLEINGIQIHLEELPIAWTRLESLAIHTDAGCLAGLPRFDELRSLELRLNISSDQLSFNQFVQSCQRLEVLVVTAYRNPARDWGLSQWRHLGKTLLKLKLHEEEMHDAVHHGQDLTVGLSDSNMMLIATGCPRLHSLGIDLVFDEGWVSLDVLYDVSNILIIRLA